MLAKTKTFSVSGGSTKIEAAHMGINSTLKRAIVNLYASVNGSFSTETTVVTIKNTETSAEGDIYINVLTSSTPGNFSIKNIVLSSYHEIIITTTGGGTVEGVVCGFAETDE